MLVPGEVLFGQYRVTKKLGAGGFAEVYKAKGLLDNKSVAIKVEKEGRFEYRTLDHEAVTLAKLHGVKGVPKVVFLKKSNGKTFLGLKDLGSDLYSLRKAGALVLTQENMVLLAYHLLTIIEAVHSRGVLHMDIKPDNILMSRGKQGKIHLIDFGIAKDWKQVGKKGGSFMGSALFCSARRMENRVPARRDDLESWLYTIIFLFSFSLPWGQSAVNHFSGWQTSVAEAKRSVEAADLCAGLPQEFCELATLIRILKPLERPNYEQMKKVLAAAAARMDIDLTSRIQLTKDGYANSPCIFTLTPSSTQKTPTKTMRALSAFQHLSRAHTITPSEVLKPAESNDHIATPKNIQFTPVVTEPLRSHLVAAKLRSRRVSAHEEQSLQRKTETVRKGGDKTMREMEKVAWSAMLIFPDEKLFHHWNGLIGVLLVYSVVVTPYRISFTDTDSLGWVIIDTIIDLLFFVDMLVSSNLVYYDQDKNIVTSHKRIFAHYLKTWFFVDLLACFPLQLIGEARLDFGNILRLARFSRVYKIVRMFKVLRTFKLAKTGHEIFRYMNQVFLISLGFERLFLFIVILTVTLHLITCAWVFAGRFNMDYDATNWIAVYGYSDLQGGDLYIVAMYWTVTTVATVGYGDLHACNVDEMIVTCVVVLIGVCVYSYLVGSLTNLISSLDTRKAKLVQQLHLLNELAKEYNLNQPFKEKIASALEYQHKNVNKDLAELTATLPPSLKSQLIVIMHRKKIERNVFFEGKPDSFLAFLVPLLSPFRLGEDEFVYKRGELATEMYFLVTGEVEFVLEKHDVLICYVSISANYYFGELDLLFADDNLRMHTTKTATQTELLALPRTHFEKLLQTFENESFEILVLAEERRHRIDQVRRKAEADYQVKKQVDKHYSVPLQLEDRLEKTESLKEELEKEGAATIDQQLLLLSERQDLAPLKKFCRLNTFGDTEYTQFTQRQSKLLQRVAGRKKSQTVSNRQLMEHVLRLEEAMGQITRMVTGLKEVPSGFKRVPPGD